MFGGSIGRRWLCPFLYRHARRFFLYHICRICVGMCTISAFESDGFKGTNKSVIKYHVFHVKISNYYYLLYSFTLLLCIIKIIFKNNSWVIMKGKYSQSNCWIHHAPCFKLSVHYFIYFEWSRFLPHIFMGKRLE